ncbi:F0F1 ATP synthase subunit B [Clostridium sp. MSJ-11]|uniref:ATP synthase subunit b n=1 Tax=Clostridium mobile TaxID=2841512 RepID=A0ABS6ELM0_9CLOT|nr:F0F1 ATP synthase subunit B [Clostridium mobile]MBU5486120.1 F0F1 ATP synthase subunit B [Clostridium mobile]
MIDISQSIATVINFIIFLFAMKFFLFKPIQSKLIQRENYIKEKIENAKTREEKAESLSIEKDKELQESKQQGKTLVEEYKYKAEKISEEIIKEAHDEANLIIQRARAEIELEKEKARDEVKNKIIDVSILMSSKALEETIDEKKQRELIKDFISKVGI